MLSNRTSIYRSKTLHVSVIVRGYLMKNLLKISLTLAGKEKKNHHKENHRLLQGTQTENL